MGRNKYPEVTENRILEISMKLFIEKGYEQTTLQDVAEAIGMTRGAIYHHFKNKEHMVDAVTTYIFNKAVPMQSINEDENLSALQKMRKLICASISSDDQLKIMLQLSKSFYDNPKLVADYLSNAVEDVVSIFLELIEEGVSDGSITVDEPKLVAELLSILFNIWLSPMIFSESKSIIRKKFDYVTVILEALGFALIDDEIKQTFDQFVAALPA